MYICVYAYSYLFFMCTVSINIIIIIIVIYQNKDFDLIFWKKRYLVMKFRCASNAAIKNVNISRKKKSNF